MNFRVNRVKILISVAAILLFYIIIIMIISNMCSTILLLCREENGFSFIPDCCRTGSTIIENIGQLILLVSPGFLLYIMWSLAQKK